MCVILWRNILKLVLLTIIKHLQCYCKIAKVLNHASLFILEIFRYFFVWITLIDGIQNQYVMKHESASLLHATENLEFNCRWFFGSSQFFLFPTTMTTRQSSSSRRRLTTWLKFSFLWYSHKTFDPDSSKRRL